MTKSEFQDLQRKAALSGTTLKEFLQSVVMTYSTYKYWSKKIRTGSEPMPIAPISLRDKSHETTQGMSMPEVTLPGVTVAFPNGVKAHFGQGSERVLMELLSQSMR